MIISVSCLYVGNLCTNGDVRLITEGAAAGGRVEVCYHGIWGSVCNEMWDNLDAQVACNQLKLPSNGKPCCIVIFVTKWTQSSFSCNCYYFDEH